jgi:hypothetical protein
MISCNILRERNVYEWMKYVLAVVEAAALMVARIGPKNMQ